MSLPSFGHSMSATSPPKILLLPVALVIASIIGGGLVAGTPLAGAAVTSCPGTGGSFAGGSGTTADPYLVSNQAQLEAIKGSSYPTCAFKQTGDIALSGPWTPIGASYQSRFTGEFDGGGYQISGINISASGQSYWGFFGYTEGGAVIKNMRLAGSVNIPGGNGIGALVGLADRPTTIVNVQSSVDVTAQERVGGLVGWLAESSITRSSSSGSVVGTRGSLGGLVGYARGSYSGIASQVTNSFATGSVTGPVAREGIAGLVGRVESGAPGVEISNSYSVGTITGGDGSGQECPDPSDPTYCYPIVGTTGGLVGPDSTSDTTAPWLTVTDSFWDKDTSGRTTTAGGKGTGATTAQMKAHSTFASAGWDISNGWSASKVWGICDGSTYPFLTAQYTSTPCATPPGPTPTPDPGPTPTPDPSPEPSTSPQLKLSITAPRSVRAGGNFRIFLTVTNGNRDGEGVTARGLRACLAKPRGIYIVRDGRGTTRARNVCWTRPSLAAGKSVTFPATVRSSRTLSGRARITATVSASNDEGQGATASSGGTVRVVEPQDPEPRPPTG